MSGERRKAQCNELRDLLDTVCSGYLSSSDESICIKVTHSMTLQNMFDKWYAQSKINNKMEERKREDGRVFFRDLNPGQNHKCEFLYLFYNCASQLFSLLRVKILSYYDKYLKCGM